PCRLQNLTVPKSGVILPSGVLGIFIIRSPTAKSKKSLYGAVYANSRARDENEINKVSIVGPPALSVVRQLPEIPVAWLDEHTNNGAVTTADVCQVEAQWGFLSTCAQSGCKSGHLDRGGK